MIRKITLAAALTLTVATASSQRTYDELREISSLNRGVYGLQSMRDGEHYTVRRGNSIVKQSYADPEAADTLYTGAFGGYAFSPDEEMLLLSANSRPVYRHSFYADYDIVRVGGERVASLKNVRDVTISPDSRLVAYARDNDLYVGPLGGEARAVTDDGEWNKVINGTADWVYEEEYGFTKAYAFSPDSKRIAYLRFDESEVPTFQMMRFDRKLYNEPYSFKYPKAGDPNSKVELWLYDIASGAKSRVDTGSESDQYIPFIGWTPDGDLYFYRVNRKQNRFEVVLCRDNGTQKVIYDETSPTYVERPERGTVRFIDGDRFLVMNETTTGWNHIYLHSVAKGLVRPLTSGEWQVTGIAEVTDDAVYYLSTERSPLRRDLYAVDFKGKRKRRLTDRDGTYSIAPSKGMKYYISTFSSATEGNTVELRGGDGRFIRTLAESEKMTERMKSLPRREFFTFVSERGDSLNAYIIKPTAIGGRPPLVRLGKRVGRQRLHRRMLRRPRHGIHGRAVQEADVRQSGRLGGRGPDLVRALHGFATLCRSRPYRHLRLVVRRFHGFGMRAEGRRTLQDGHRGGSRHLVALLRHHLHRDLQRSAAG